VENTVYLSRVKNNDDTTVWTTSFPLLLNFSEMEKNNWYVHYIYEILAHRNFSAKEIGPSEPYGRCALCGYFGRH